MQTVVSEPKLRAGSGEKLSEPAVSRAAVKPAFSHRRGRRRLDLSWRFKLAAVGAVSALVAISLLLQ